MQLIFLLLISCILAYLAVYGTQKLLSQPRRKKVNLLLFSAGILICGAASVFAEIVLCAGRPVFYYHTHPLGFTTVKIFCASCFIGAVFFALFLLFCERKDRNDSVRNRLIIAFLLGILGSVLLEIGFFNFRHFELIGSQTTMKLYPSDKIYGVGLYFNRASWKFHPYTKNSELGFVVYTNNKKIRNIAFEYDDGTPRTVVRLGYNDKSHQDYVYLPDHSFIQNIPRSYIIPLHTVGTTYSVSLQLPELNVSGSQPGISLPQIIINQIVPLEIDPVRLGLSFIVIFLAAVFFPGSPVWNLPLNLHDCRQVLAAVGLFLIFIAAMVWTVFSSYSGSDLSFSEQKAALNGNYLQYNRLVEALMVPRYALLETPHRYLEQLTDPYDMQKREEKDFDYLWDTAYFEGKYYVYFGVVPAVTVLLPYRLLTGNYLELDYPILGFACLFIIGLYGVYSLLVQRYFRHISFGAYGMGIILLITPLNLTWCLRRTLVYELAIMSGICFAVWSIYFMLLADTNGKLRYMFLFLSGASVALAVGCRPTMIFVLFVDLTIWICRIKSDGSMNIRNEFPEGLLFLLPCFLVGFALMKYNFERFGNPFEFGITYQLTTENRAVGLPLLGSYGRLLSIFSSLFTLPRVDLNFPFIHLQIPELPYNGVILNSDTVLGLFSYPLMSFLWAFPFEWRNLRKHGRLLIPLFCSCLVAALAICVTASAFAITNRYLTDYLYLAALPAVFLLFCFIEKCNEKNWPRLGQTIALLCAAAGVCLFFALSLAGEENWFRSINPLYFDKLRYAFSPWL